MILVIKKHKREYLQVSSRCVAQ